MNTMWPISFISSDNIICTSAIKQPSGCPAEEDLQKRYEELARKRWVQILDQEKQ